MHIHINIFVRQNISISLKAVMNVCQDEISHVAKVVLVGNSGVGKTCLTEILSGGEVYWDGGDDNSKQHVATIGVDFKARIVKVSEEW